MDEFDSLSHTKWDCKYHIVFIPKCRRRTPYEELRKHLGEVFRRLAEQKESRVEEGHLMPDHVHMMIAIPPKYAVSQVVGYIKGKSAIHLARVYGERKRSFVGQHFWARGYFVSTVGRDEELIREYIRHQEGEDNHVENCVVIDHLVAGLDQVPGMNPSGIGHHKPRSLRFFTARRGNLDAASSPLDQSGSCPSSRHTRRPTHQTAPWRALVVTA
jgi:putative transposase